MTQQETFDTVVRALLAQGRPSRKAGTSIGGTGCQYRTLADDGAVLKCAAGHLIPDDEYLPEMEGYNCIANDEVDPLRSRGELRIQAILERHGHDPQLVRKLQYAHDMSRAGSFVADFRVRAEEVARAFDLSPDALGLV